MIESNVNNQVSSALRQAQAQDVRSLQNQQEDNDRIVADEASSRPVASSGVQASDNLAPSVSTQPSDVVTRLGETTEQVPLYEPNRTAGTIIRPAIELAQNAQELQQAAAAEAQQTVIDRQSDSQAASESREPVTPARGRDPSPDDVQNLV